MMKDFNFLLLFFLLMSVSVFSLKQVSLDNEYSTSINKGLIIVNNNGVNTFNYSLSVKSSGITYDYTSLKSNVPTLNNILKSSVRNKVLKWSANVTGIPPLIANDIQEIRYAIQTQQKVFNYNMTIEENIKGVPTNLTIPIVAFEDGTLTDFKDQQLTGTKVHYDAETKTFILTEINNAYNLLTQTFVIDPTIQSSCGTLSTANTTYELSQDVSSTAGCFTIAAENITLNGMGRTVTYANASTGVGITIAAGAQRATVINITIQTLPPPSNSGNAITVNDGNFSLLNSTIYALNTTAAGRGVEFDAQSESEALISGNTIITNGQAGSEAILIDAADYIKVTYNTLNSSGQAGITIQRDANYNLIENNYVNSSSNNGVIRSLIQGNAGPTYNNITNNELIGRGTSTSGIDYSSASNFTLIKDNNISFTTTTATTAGLRFLARSSHNVITGNRIRMLGNNNLIMLLISTNSTNNTFYNNIFNGTGLINKTNSGRSYVNDTTAELLNVFNLPITSGTNIVGGSNLGGNYYTNQTANEFSDLCTDANLDSICDVGYNYFRGTDAFPLGPPQAPIGGGQGAGNATITFPTNGQTLFTTNISLNYTQNGSTTNPYTWYIYLNGTFNKTVTTNTTLNLSGGSYQTNVSAYNGSVWTPNYTVQFNIYIDQPSGFLDVTLNNALNINVTANTTFTINASAICEGVGGCGNLNSSLYYNWTGPILTPLNVSLFAIPFYNSTGLTNISHGTLSNNQIISHNITINVSNVPRTYWLLIFNFTNGTSQNGSLNILLNVSDIIVSPPAPPANMTNGSLLISTSYTQIDVNQNETFTIDATTTCSGGNCSLITARIWYNLTGLSVNTSLNYTVLDKPFFNVSGLINQSCGNLNDLDTCLATWNINATGNVNTTWRFTINFTSNNSLVVQNGTGKITVNINEIITSSLSTWIFAASIIMFTALVVLFKSSKDLEEQHWPYKTFMFYSGVYMMIGMANVALKWVMDNNSVTQTYQAVEIFYVGLTYLTYFLTGYLIIKFVWWGTKEVMNLNKKKELEENAF